MKRSHEFTSDDANVAKKQKGESVEIPEALLGTTTFNDLPLDILSKHILPVMDPATITMTSMSSKALSTMANDVKKEVYSNDLVALFQAVQDNPKPSPLYFTLRKGFARLFPLSENCVTRALLYNYFNKALERMDPELINNEIHTGSYYDTFVHLKGYPQVTILAIKAKLYPKLEITTEFLKEIPLEGLDLTGFDLKLNIRKIAQDGFLDELLMLTKISNFQLDDMTLEMLHEKSVDKFLQRVEGFRRAGEVVSFQNWTYTIFLKLLTMEDYLNAPEAVEHILRPDLMPVHFNDVIRSKLSTETVVELLSGMHTRFSHAELPLLLQAGRNKQDILDSSIFNAEQRYTFRTLDHNSEAHRDLSAEMKVSITQMAILSEIDFLERVWSESTIQPRIHEIILAFIAQVPTEFIIKMCKRMKPAITVNKAELVYEVKLPYDIVKFLASKVPFPQLKNLVCPTQIGEFMVKMYEEKRIPASYLASALKHYFTGLDYSNPTAIDSMLRIQDGRPFFQYKIFTRSDLSDKVAHYLLDTFEIPKLAELVSAFDHLDDSADDKDASGRRTLTPHLLRRVANTPGGIHSLRRLGYERFFVSMFQNRDFYNNFESDRVPGSSFHYTSSESIVRALGFNAARNGYQRFILMDHIAQNFEDFDGIDLALGVQEQNIDQLNWTIDMYAKFMSGKERAEFLKKSKNMPGCKLTAAVQKYASEAPKKN